MYKPKKIIATRSTINSGYKIKKNFKCEFEIIVRAYEDFINVKRLKNEPNLPKKITSFSVMLKHTQPLSLDAIGVCFIFWSFI